MPDVDKRFVYFDSPQVPLKEVPYGDLKANITDPTTGKPYKGIVLEGVFAQFSDIPNNNKRIYSIPEYLELLQVLKKQILSPKGVYGELEHPTKYSVNFNNVSHKILDVWWDEATQCVYGRVLLLNTPKGKIAQEIIKSGGQLAISGRAAGDEIPQSDGSYKAVTKLLTTYDLVYHPGFSSAVLEFKELNEAQKFIQHVSENKNGFAFKVYSNQLNKIQDAYEKYINMNESTELLTTKRSMCFLEWFNLFESEQSKQDSKQDSKQEKVQEQQEQQIIEENEPLDKDEKQQKLEDAVNKELKENQNIIESKNKNLKNQRLQKLKKRLFFEEVESAQNKLKKKLDTAFYDNSAGFINNQISFENTIVNN